MITILFFCSTLLLVVSIAMTAPPIGKYPDYLTWPRCGWSKTYPDYEKLYIPSKCSLYFASNPSQTNGKSDTQSRVMYGREARQHESPWTVKIKYNNLGIGCTGSIIGDRWILTAAHCVHKDAIKPVVVPGHLRLPRQAFIPPKPKWPADPVLNYNVKVLYGSSVLQKSKSIDVIDGYPHNLYNYSDHSTYKYDIGLLKLRHSIPRLVDQTKEYFSTNTVCLPDVSHSSDFSRENGTIFGWGLTYGNRAVSTLRRAQFVLYPCQSYPGMNFSDFLCSIPRISDHSCSGDSGSGLVQYTIDKKQAVLIGITIGNDNNTIAPENVPCTNPRKRTQFIYLYKWLDWILKTIRDNNG